jgi:signal transduction histidine kinase
MNLASFITSNLDPILAEWERFARTLLPSAATMDSLALRDHARQILEAIAKDIVQPQTSAESGEKSRGTEDSEAAIDTAAAVHGTLRHTAGFDLRQLFAEYRALRASVLRLWSERAGDASPDALYQMTRFNEAIDQALAESVARFSDDVARSRDTFIAVLGHDLRSPLQAISASASTLEDSGQPAASHAAALTRIRAGVLGMSKVIRDLLEYTRTRLGKTIPINAAAANVEAIVRDSLGEVGAGHPQHCFRVETGNDLHALVDSTRLQQAITNLLGNAVEHGRQGGIVELIARKDGGWLAIEVSNEGPAIPPDRLQGIFDPLLHTEVNEPKRRAAAHLGLGLFIAREIAHGHGGSIEAHSSDRRTTFTIRIPLRSRTSGQAAAISAAA